MTQTDHAETEAPGARKLGALAERLRGPLLTTESPGYDEARALFNARKSARPLAIACCENVDDVRAALAWARASGVPLSVRAGGHGVHGLAIREGGLVIDLRAMDGVAIAADARQARVGGGARWNAVYEAAAAHGLGPTGGTETSVGVVGFTIGSGNAWLMRRHGLACDNVVSFELVTADGTVREVDADDPDLFWALKGGGGNFGVITAITLQLHPVPDQISAGMTFYAAEDAERTLRGYRDVMEEAPRDTAAMWALAPFPDDPQVPGPLRGRTVVLIAMLHVGPREEGERHLERLRTLAPTVLDTVGEVPFAQGIRVLDGVAPPGLQQYWRGMYLRSLDDEAVATTLPLVAVAPEMGMQVWRMGGAVDDVPAGATAIPRGERRYFMGLASAWVDPAESERIISATDAAGDAFAPWSSGACPNHVDRLTGEELRAALGEEIHDRLRAVKRQVDPGNVFAANQNIEP
ncbi:MAG: linked oxidase protein [Solirubrobacterales bacterium]|nr:linked oxidase protein [Solirubrobacterales bacterium]